MANINSQSNKGNAVPLLTRGGTVNIGVRLDNGYIYVRPRINADENITGASITTTNPAYAYRNQRTASIGMNAAGQQKRWS
jgi:hypothetical protein